MYLFFPPARIQISKCPSTVNNSFLEHIWWNKNIPILLGNCLCSPPHTIMHQLKLLTNVLCELNTLLKALVLFVVFSCGIWATKNDFFEIFWSF